MAYRGLLAELLMAECDEQPAGRRVPGRCQTNRHSHRLPGGVCEHQVVGACQALYLVDQWVGEQALC